MKKLEAPGKVIFICDGKKCGKYSKELRKGFKDIIKAAGMKHEIELVRMDCTDNCKCAPVICLQPQNVWIGEVNVDKISAIYNELLVNNKHNNKSNEPGSKELGAQSALE